MKLFSYVVAHDYGFAPNPFYGYCTLATCKPRIRAVADAGDWIIGTGAKKRYNLSGHLIYAMKVEEVLTFDQYWADPRFRAKRPVLNGSLKQIHGDNIYHRTADAWVQEDSRHSREGGIENSKNVTRDTAADRVLISRLFVYFGASAIRIPAHFRPFAPVGRDICSATQGHRTFAHPVAAAVEEWLRAVDRWGLQGLPLEFDARWRKALPASRRRSSETATLA